MVAQFAENKSTGGWRRKKDESVHRLYPVEQGFESRIITMNDVAEQ
jgi:hypothetical protein